MSRSVKNSRNSLLVRSAVLALLLAVPAVAFAKDGRPDDSPGNGSGGGNGQGGVSSGKFEARLRSPSDPSAASHGSLKVERTAKKGVLKEARIDIKAELAPVSIADSTSELRVEVSRAGAVVATCLAVFDEIDDEHRVPLAEYKTDVRLKKGSTKSKAGYCDLDPTTPSVDNGIPTVAVGDTVAVINPVTSEVLLSGTVGKKGRR